MRGDSDTHSKVEALIATAQLDLPVRVDDFIFSVNMDTSGSGIEYLGHDDFGIYDYPAAEEWARECSWEADIHYLGDGSFHYVVFKDTKGAVDFKLRWGREVVKNVR
jgi:hypothetical protein